MKIPREHSIEACKASNIMPDENDVFLFFGEANFHPDWKHTTLPTFRMVDKRREESSAYGENGNISATKRRRTEDTNTADRGCSTASRKTMRSLT